MNVKIQRVTGTAKLPAYATEGSVGMDLHADIGSSIRLLPGATELIPTGLRFELPENHGLFILPRSGLVVRHKVTVLNTPGLIDPDYRGEVSVVLHNFGREVFHVKPDARIAQCMILPIPMVYWQEVTELSHTARGAGGFGSSGE